MPIVRRSRKYRAIIGRRCEAYAPLTSGYNGLVGGSNPPSPTTQSCATGDFLKVYERSRIGGDPCDGPFSETASLQSAGRFWAFFSAPKSRFPETETAGGRDSFECRLRRGKSEHLVLARPVGGQVSESGHSHAMRQPPRDGRFHEIGRQEGKRDRHVDLPNAAPLALSDAFRICVGVGKKFVEPAAASRNRCHQERAGLRAYRTSVLRWKPRGQKNLPTPR
jgi:hypothetical protein